MKHLLLAAALAFAPASAFAQSAAPAPAIPEGAPQLAPTPAAAPLPDADPALWVIRDADTTIYLFGTFHLLDARPWFNDEVKTAFDASSELVMEAIIPEDQSTIVPMIMRYAVDPNGRKLSERLSAADNAALGQALAPLGVPANAFDRFEPWYMSIVLTVSASQRLGISGANGPETILSRAARARQMPIGELEGLEWQMRLFDSMPEPLQLTQLHETLQELDTIPRILGPALAAWSSGDVDGLVRILNAQSDDDPTLHRLLLTDRNRTWAGWIQERMSRPGTVFIAVGAAHLAGPDSVIAALHARHVEARRVPHMATAH